MMAFNRNDRLTTHILNLILDIDIQTCVFDAIKFFRATPRSACLRKHETDASQIVNCPEDAVSTWS